MEVRFIFYISAHAPCSAIYALYLSHHVLPPYGA